MLGVNSDRYSIHARLDPGEDGVITSMTNWSPGAAGLTRPPGASRWHRCPRGLLERARAARGAHATERSRVSGGMRRGHGQSAVHEGVTVCAGVVALVGCWGVYRLLPHAVAMPRDGRHSAALTVASGVATVIAGPADLGAA